MLLEQTWVKKEDGLSDEWVEGEARAADPLKAHLVGIVEAWVEGELEPLRKLGGGHANLDRRETVERTSVRDPSTNKLRHDCRWIPIQLRHVLAAKLRTRGPAGEEFNPETGEDIQPFVRLVLDDGTKVDLPYRDVSPAMRAHAETSVVGA